MTRKPPAGGRGQLTSDGRLPPLAAGAAAATGTPPSGTRPASIGKRVGAYMIDYLAVNIALVVVAVRTGLLSTNLDVMSQEQAYIAGVVSSGVALLYFALLEAAFGRTLAKRLLGVKVVTADGTRPGMRAALTRRLLFVAGMVVPVVGGLLTFAVPLAAVVTAIQDEPIARGFHDRWAGTLVVEA